MKPNRTITAFAILLSALVLLPFAKAEAQSILYGTTGGGNPGALYTIDPVTGTATFVANLVDAAANPYAVTGLAFDSVGTLYGSTSSQSPTGPSELVTINPLTGLVTQVGSFGTAATMADLTFNSANNTLYGGNSATANLYSISLVNGQATLIGPSGVTGAAGVGIAANGAGTIYGTPDGSSGDLVTYSTGDGSTTFVAALSGAPHAGAINALTFNNSSTVLYGVNVDQTNVARPADVVTIDVTTGLVTDLAGGSVNFLDAIAFSVPEPSTWLVGALAFGAIVLSQRKRILVMRRARMEVNR